jgi:antirestriction protein ArdC
MARRDFRKETTDKIIELIESGEALPWEKGWNNVAVSPFNPFSGSKFRKGNKLNLLFIQSARGSIDPRWMTMNQIKKAGYSLRAGSKAALVEYWNVVEKEPADESGIDDKNASETQDSDKSSRPSVFSRLYYEFNGEDIIGLPELSYAEPSFDSNEMIER